MDVVLLIIVGLVLGFWIMPGAIAASIAMRKGGNPVGWTVLGVLFGPFAWLAAAIDTGKECPHCRSRIHPKATRCPKCSGDLAPGWASRA